jgi:hypothetical protein
MAYFAFPGTRYGVVLGGLHILELELLEAGLVEEELEIEDDGSSVLKI